MVYAVLEFYIWAKWKWRLASLQAWLYPKWTYPLNFLNFSHFSTPVKFVAFVAQNQVISTSHLRITIIIYYITVICLPYSYKCDEYDDVTDYIIIILQCEILALPTNHLLAYILTTPEVLHYSIQYLRVFKIFYSCFSKLLLHRF